MKKTAFILLLLAGCFAGGYYVARLQQGGAPMGQGGAVPFVPTGLPVVQPKQANTRFIALVKPLNAVDVRPQVTGEIKQVLFTDGQAVQADDTLFLIDPDKYQANLGVARAALAKAQADVKQLKNDYKRQTELYKDKFVSTADLEKSESKLAQAEAAVEQAKANLELAQIDMEHTMVKAPISGRIGQALITKGNYVTLSSDPLARIVQTTPVKISFSITDKEYLQLVRTMKNKNSSKKTRLSVELADGMIIPLPVDRVIWDNEMDRETATVNLYVEFDNKDGLVVPNNHVTVLWYDGDDVPVVLVPQTAVYNDANGTYVMRVNDDNTVVQQYVTQGQTVDNKIEVSGLDAHDTIVVSGGQKLRSGQTIQPIQTEAK